MISIGNSLPIKMNWIFIGKIIKRAYFEIISIKDIPNNNY